MTTDIRLSAVHVYPVKSLRGIPVDVLTIEGGRVAGDRLWMLVDRHGRFMHQRDHAVMATIDVRPKDGGIELESPDGGVLFLDPTAPDPTRRVAHVRMWRRAAPVVPVGDHADAWCSAALGVPCHLVRYAESAAGLDVPASEADAALQDATPFHLTSEDSLADLTRRMGRDIPMIRFRPNLTVAGASPYAEDNWRDVQIGAHRFHWVRPCTRCVLTTTDHQTGGRDARQEPLRTLATYRRLPDGEVGFGHYVTTTSRSGALRVGDPVVVMAGG